MDSVRKYIEPVKKKWVYNFLVAPSTSRIDKPEWFLNKTLEWINEHVDEIEKKIDPESCETKDFGHKHSFILCMLELVRERLDRDMKMILQHIDNNWQYEAILIHIYNEVIVFVKIIRQLLGDKYSILSKNHDVMEKLSHQKLFELIADNEWDYAKKNLIEMKESQSKWDPVLEGDYVDPYKIPRCVDRFLLQIKSISERVECFRQEDCQFQLIDLQCSLFGNFLDFMRQSTESAPIGKNLISDFLFLSEESTIDLSKILRVLNGVNFLRLILIEKCFIPKVVIDKLNEDLTKRLNRITTDYKQFFNKLVLKVVEIYQLVDSDLPEFYSFIQPKLANDIFVTIRDETTKLHETRQTQQMLKGLTFRGK